MTDLADQSHRPAIATDTARFTVRVHSDVAALPDHWPRAAAKGRGRCTVFQLREYLDVAAETVGTAHGRQLFYVEVNEDNGNPVLLLALALEQRGAARVLCFTDFDIVDYNAPVLFPTDFSWTETLARALWREISSALPSHDAVELLKMPARVDGLNNPLALLATAAEIESAHGNDLTLGRDAVMARQNQVRNTERNIRKLRRESGLEFRFADTAEERDRFIAVALEQKQRRFDQTHLAGFHAEPEKKLFFERATEALSRAKILQFCALIIDGNIVATSWNLVHGRTCLAMMLSHDDAVWGRVGPSRLLNHLLLDHLLETDCVYYDLGFGDEPYKVQQCETAVPLVRAQMAVTPSGHVYLMGSRLREQLRETRIWKVLKDAKWAVQDRLRRRDDTAT